MKLHAKDQGSYGEALVVSQIICNNNSAFTQFGDNSKIDIIVECNSGKLHKVQVKTVGREKRTPDVSKLYLVKHGPNYSFKYDDTMVDWFAVVDLVTQKIAWIDAKRAFKNNVSQLTLRHSLPKNGQKSKINLFEDFTKYPFT